jgi:hypothetical protein
LPFDATKTVKAVVSAAAALALAGGLVVAAPASANLYNWTLSGANSGAGTLTTGAADNGGYDIATFLGEINGVTVTLAGTPLNPGPGSQTSPLGAFTYDNIAYNAPGSKDVLDNAGILVSFVGSPGPEGNIWANGGTSYSYYTGTGGGSYSVSDGSAIFSITEALDPAPEPMTLALLGSGLVGLAVARRRKHV